MGFLLGGAEWYQALLRRFGRLLPAAQQLLQGLRVFMTTIDGGLQPAAGDGVVLFDTVTVVVQAGEVVLGFGVALLRGLLKPVGGTRRIFLRLGRCNT